MSHQAGPDLVQLYTPAQRERVLLFLRTVDRTFVPPLSSPLRQGSLEAYLDYSLAAGRGRIVLYGVEDRIVGYLAFRYEPGGADKPCEAVYLSNMCVSESFMGLTLIRLMRGMECIVTRELATPPLRIWAKTWRGNSASSRTLERLGMEHLQTIPSDPDFGQCRDTLIYSGPWNVFVGKLRELDPPTETDEVHSGEGQ